jgi:hypothetical protein
MLAHRRKSGGASKAPSFAEGLAILFGNRQKPEKGGEIAGTREDFFIRNDADSGGEDFALRPGVFA